MSMTHREALDMAINVYFETPGYGDGRDMVAAFSAYIEALGLALVPREATEKMQRHGVTGLCNNGLGHVDYSDARECYKAMLAAAPDPFAEGE